MHPYNNFQFALNRTTEQLAIKVTMDCNYGAIDSDGLRSIFLVPFITVSVSA